MLQIAYISVFAIKCYECTDNCNEEDGDSIDCTEFDACFSANTNDGK